MFNVWKCMRCGYTLVIDLSEDIETEPKCPVHKTNLDLKHGYIDRYQLYEAQ